MKMNKYTTPANGDEYLAKLAQNKRPALSPTSFEITPEIKDKNPEILTSLIAEEVDKIWDHDLFNKDGRFPINVWDTKGLLDVPVNAYANEMLIKMPGTETLTLPDNFKPLTDLIQSTIDIDANHFDRFCSDYAYLTYQEDYMEPDTFQRFYGCHVDGFQSHRVHPKLPIDRSYLAVDRDPTIFYPHAFDMNGYDTKTHDFFAVFNTLAQEEKSLTLTPYWLYLFNAVSVHRASASTRSGFRRFFRITFSQRINDRAGSTKNPHIDYDWDFRLQQTRATVKGIVNKSI